MCNLYVSVRQCKNIYTCIHMCIVLFLYLFNYIIYFILLCLNYVMFVAYHFIYACVITCHYCCWPIDLWYTFVNIEKDTMIIGTLFDYLPLV